MQKITLSIFACLLAATTFAEIKMPRIFSDGMMFQRDIPVNVWGTATAGAAVDVSFGAARVSATAGADGKWYAKLPASAASATPRELVVRENGREAARVKNVLVGEVWIAGGQSNMAFGLGGMDGSKEIIKRADSVPVRYFNQPRHNTQKTPQWDTADDSKWIVASSKNVGGMSAVAYAFAQKLSENLGVPVGIVQTAISGTNMYSWVPFDEFEKNPLFADSYKSSRARLKNWNYEKEIVRWNELVRTYPERVEKAKKAGKEPPPKWTIGETLKPWKDTPDGYRTPSYLYNGRVAPLTNYSARAFLWYQGENDNMKKGFKCQFKGLVEIWRKQWRNPDMFFLFVQLPSWGGSPNWPEMRWAQFSVCRELKNMGMAVSIDTGDQKDVHPHDKLPFINRLVNIALHDVYGKKSADGYGPIFKKADFSGSYARVDFYSGGGKLVLKGEPRGFEVRSDGKWIPASAKLKGASVVVKATDKAVRKIDGVRYLWASWALPEVCIFDESGNPAPSFTTDALE